MQVRRDQEEDAAGVVGERRPERALLPEAHRQLVVALPCWSPAPTVPCDMRVQAAAVAVVLHATRRENSGDCQSGMLCYCCIQFAGEKRRLRVGYVSSDFVNHPTADLIQTALLLHDRER